MRAKLVVAAALFSFNLLGNVTSVDAQIKFGLRLAPVLSFNRVQDKSKNDNGTPVKYESGSPTVSISAGVFADYFFRSNYAVNFNLWYTVKRQSVKSSEFGTIDYNLQMIQLPVCLKLFTNEISPDLKLYFQLGASPDFIITEKLKNYSGNAEDEPEGKLFNTFDLSLLFGTGVEYRVGEQTSLIGGISYNRGLLNLISSKGAFDEGNKADDRYTSRSDIVAIDLGVKF